jgi:hypothetical protein
MAQRLHRGRLQWSIRGLAIIAPLAAAAGIALGVLPLRQQRNGDSGVVRRMATEMPRYDSGIQQAVHATFVGNRQPALGQPADLMLVVTSGSADVNVRAEISVPEHATFEKGPSRWEGTLSELEQAEIPVSVALPGDHGAFVHAQITAVLPDGREFTTGTAVYVDPGDPDHPVAEHRTLIEPDGRPLEVVIDRPSDR